MLVLSRKVGEKIRIGRNIYITVVRSQDGKTRLGIEAPPEIPVVRSEIDTEPPADGTSPCPMPEGPCCCALRQCALDDRQPQSKAS